MEKTVLKEGYFQIYTGNCKGKTTAALGLAFRAAGHGLKTYIGQFMKGQDYGELKTAKILKSYITIEQYGTNTFVDVRDKPIKDDVSIAKKGLETGTEAMLSGNYDIVILDEICMANFFNLLTLDEVLAVISQKPNNVELIFTGRYANKELVKLADLVTEMKEIKHYYSNGIIARAGIER